MKQVLFVLTLFQSSLGVAQKTLTWTEAEQQLQTNNLLLLAEKYNISASQAAVIQAKIWELPYLSAEFNAINPQDGKVFSVGGQGQKGLSVEQLIYLGGKKKNEVEFAKSNLSIAELQFEQLIRNLKYELQQNFYTLFFDNQKIVTLENQIEMLDNLLNNYTIQALKGNIPLKEVVRLQTLVLELKSDKNDVLKGIAEASQTLALLTGISEPVSVVTNEAELINIYQNKLILKETILSSALEKNLDYLTAIKVSESQELQLKWQRSLAINDLTAGASYDQRGGAFKNQINFTVGIPLPLWNKNKGNIKIAEAQLNQTNLNVDYKKLEVETHAAMIWTLWQQQQKQLNGIDMSTMQNLNAVYDGMIANFQKRNINLLEFTDFMETYNQTTIQVNEIKKALILSGISLNYITNTEIF